jgi:hypothetical protein
MGKKVAPVKILEDSMTHLALIMNEGTIPNVGMWFFLSVGAIALFAIFLPAVRFLDTRRKEREAFYRAENLRRVTESSAEGAKAAMEMMREEARRGRITKREGLKIGGLINIGVGAALMIFLHSVGGHDSPWLCGLIPGFIGIAMLIYVFFLAGPIE